MADVDHRYYKEWSELNDKQRERSGSRAEHSASRESAGLKGVSGGYEQHQKRMAGDAIVENADPKPVAKQVENINDYDNTSYGAGYRQGANRVSRKDLQELERQGFSHQEIIDYSEEQVKSGALQGEKAQNLLNKYKAGLSTPEPAPQPQPQPQPAPQPEPQPTPPPRPAPQPEPPKWTPTPPPAKPPVGGPNPPPGSGDRPERPIQVPTPYDPPPWDPNRQVTNIIDDYTNWADRRNIGWSNDFVKDTKYSDAVMERGTNIDKPGDAESFVNKYVNMNNNLATQSRANRPDITTNAVNNINQYGVDLTALDTSIRQRGQISRDRALISASNLFGDMHAMTPPDWKSGLGKQPEVESPDLGDIYDEGKKDIDDLF